MFTPKRIGFVGGTKRIFNKEELSQLTSTLFIKIITEEDLTGMIVLNMFGTNAQLVKLLSKFSLPLSVLTTKGTFIAFNKKDKKDIESAISISGKKNKKIFFNALDDADNKIGNEYQCIELKEWLKEVRFSVEVLATNCDVIVIIENKHDTYLQEVKKTLRKLKKPFEVIAKKR